jgi:hypothetical protein
MSDGTRAQFSPIDSFYFSDYLFSDLWQRIFFNKTGINEIGRRTCIVESMGIYCRGTSSKTNW